jgi:hypothetical protein
VPFDQQDGVQIEALQVGPSLAIGGSETDSGHNVSRSLGSPVFGPAPGWKYPVTFDESSFYVPNQYEQIWLPDYDDPATIEHPTISSLKTIVTMAWSPHRFDFVKVLPKGQMWRVQSDTTHILAKICSLHDTRHRKVWLCTMVTPGHASLKESNIFWTSKAPHPSCSPEFAPSDFFLFRHIKRVLQEAEFPTLEELLEMTVRALNEIPLEALAAPCPQWKKSSKYV